VEKKSPFRNPIAWPRRVPQRTIDHTIIRVLVVDDEDASRTATVDLLTRRGFIGVTAADGIASALAAVREGNVDVLVLDMHMPNPEGDPGDAGLVLLRELTKLEKKPQLGVYSPGCSRRNARAARKLGAAPFLSKERDWRQLDIAVVTAWTRNLPPLSEMNDA
jgi:CheY-like chemotaxis protein